MDVTFANFHSYGTFPIFTDLSMCGYQTEAILWIYPCI